MVEDERAEELRFINAFIGFCTPTLDTWPQPLVPLGYRAYGVEREIKTILEGQDRTVVVDLICASDTLHHVLCVETKSATLHVDQARRYLALTSSNLLNMARLPPSIDARRVQHDVAYVTDRENARSLSRQLQELELDLAVIAGNEDRFDLVNN